MIDQKTVNRDYPLPHADNKLREDVVRLNDAFVDIDTDVNDLYASKTNIQDVQNGTLLYADSTGDGTAYQVVLNPAPTGLNTGLLIHMKAHVQNTGSATLNANSLGIKTIKKTDGNDLKAGDIISGSACFLFYDGINFQLINPKVDQVQTELNTSNIMRAFEEIQENHGGSLLMETGWSDSFSNPDEQGADESSSTGYHDPVNTLYKGTDPGIGLNLDINYDTESNFLQQEWTNASQLTSQATVASGTTVTLSSGVWPTQCANGRISFDNGSTWFGIDVRDSDTGITLDSAATDGTFDFVIRMSKFDNGSIQLNGTTSLFDGGDGRDGSVTITSSKNINTNVLGSLRSGNADGISTAVTANPIGTAITVSSINGFADGDKLMLINLMGASGDIADVGNFEVLTVSGSPSGNSITTIETISKSFDGVIFSNQKIICQRIPQWTTVSVNSGGDLSCSAWNGSSGGVLAFYSNSSVTLASGGKIHADGKGYRGASHYTGGAPSTGTCGEGRAGGRDTQATAANDSGGGAGHTGGSGFQGGGGGGGHGTTGSDGIPTYSDTEEGIGGNAMGTTSLSQMFFGGGGGHGGLSSNATSTPSGGGNGGGIVYINTLSIDTLTNDGLIQSEGEGGIEQPKIGDMSGSGGGAGGSIFIKSSTLSLGSNDVVATGGLGSNPNSGTGGIGGTGGDGRIRLEYQSINSNPFQNVTEENSVANPNPGSTTKFPYSENVSAEYISVCDSEFKKTDTSAWSDINSGSISEALNSQNAYYWLVLDPSSSFGAGTEIKIFNPTDSVWRVIAKNSGSVWQYNNNSSNDTTFSPVTAGTNNMLHAVSQAISAQTGNRMIGTNLAAITDAQWEESGGWSTSINSIIGGLTLYSNSSSQNPSVSQYRLNYDSERGAMDLRSKIYDPGFLPTKGYVWSRVEHSDSDGPGTFYATRNGGTEWTAVPMVQQGSPLSGDIRIYRGTVDVNGQTSGQDLRCRYQSSQGKDQFLHSWGLQAKS
jgi:hypothetical protein